MITIDIKKLSTETEEEFLWRVGQLVDSKQIESWASINDIVNTELGIEEEKWRDESSFRKRYQAAKKFYDNCFAKMQSDTYADEVQVMKRELQKERRKLSDERINYNKLIREEARKESYIDMVKRIICENVEPTNIPVHYTLFNSETDLLCSLSDIHTGIEINNWFNTFNQDVLRERINKYTSDILDIRGTHGSQNCYLVIGEILSGLIHPNLRLQNNMDLMQQFKYISELISAMLTRMANHFANIYVYVTPGNHSRITPNKENSLDGENMDVLLPFYLKARLQNITNVYICDNNIEPEIAMFNIRGNNVFAAHGHKDKPASVVQNFTMMFGIKPDIVLLGHRHTNGLSTVYDTKIIQTGCMSGADEYATSIRKVNKPEQSVAVIDENGLLCLYDIQLD